MGMTEEQRVIQQLVAFRKQEAFQEQKTLELQEADCLGGRPPTKEVDFFSLSKWDKEKGHV